MTLPLTLILISGGFAAGLVGSLLGLGGGILIVPLLVLALDLPMQTAVATSLFCVIATSSAAASRNVELGIANIKLAVALEGWTVAGALGGSVLAGVLTEKTLMGVFATVLTFMLIPLIRESEMSARALPTVPEESPAHESGGRTFLRQLAGSYFDQAQSRQISYEVRRLPLAMGVSSLAGVLSGLLGVGGGLIKIPILTGFCGVPIKAAAATSNFMIGVTALASALVYYGVGAVAPLVTAATVIGVFGGSRLGSVVSQRTRPQLLKHLFAVVMLIVAFQFFRRALS